MTVDDNREAIIIDMVSLDTAAATGATIFLWAQSKLSIKISINKYNFNLN